MKLSSTAARPESGTDWKRFDTLTDDEIREAVSADPDAAPILDADWLHRAKVVLPSSENLEAE